MKKFVKPTYKGKNTEKLVINAACKGDLTAYVKHNPTGAMIPITSDAVRRLQNGEKIDIEEAEKTHDRFYFKLPSLAVRWGMENKECFEKLIELEVPCFFNPNQVPMDNNIATVIRDDICIFQEYVEALEKKSIKKINDLKPEFF